MTRLRAGTARPRPNDDREGRSIVGETERHADVWDVGDGGVGLAGAVGAVRGGGCGDRSIGRCADGHPAWGGVVEGVALGSSRLGGYAGDVGEATRTRVAVAGGLGAV